jgi:hypothetical protein
MGAVSEIQPLARQANGGWSNAFNLGSASSAQFQLIGGYYVLTVVATFGGGSVTLKMVGPDGSSLVATALTRTSNGEIGGFLPPGSYQIVVATATSVFATVARVQDAR